MSSERKATIPPSPQRQALEKSKEVVKTNKEARAATLRHLQGLVAQQHASPDKALAYKFILNLKTYSPDSGVVLQATWLS